MEIVRLCLARHSVNEEEDFEREYLLWEGNYWDEPVHDYATLSFSTVEVLANKVAALFEKYCEKEEKILLFLPQVIQLPLSILAGLKAGVTLIPLDPANCDEKKLENVLSSAKPVLAITVDAYWLGQNLQECYKKLDSVLEIMGKDYLLRKVFVIRHTCPNPGVPPPEEHIPARRPYYLIEWSVKEGRDVEWSQEIRQIPVDVKVAGRKNSGPVMLLPNGTDGNGFLELTEEEILQKLHVFPDLSSPVFCLTHPEKLLGLVGFLSSWSAGHQLVQYEGLLDYPDPARIAHIVRKYKVKSLVMHDIDLEEEAEEYLRLVENGNLELVALANMNRKKQLNDAFPQAEILDISFLI